MTCMKKLSGLKAAKSWVFCVHYRLSSLKACTAMNPLRIISPDCFVIDHFEFYKWIRPRCRMYSGDIYYPEFGEFCK